MDHYNIPFDINEIKKLNKYKSFKHNQNKINKIIFALNNFPSDIHTFIFSEYDYVCPKYYYITLQLDKNHNITNLLHNFEDLDDYLENHNIRFIYIRINLIQKNNIINHVNCIIIDKQLGYLLIFEPRINIKYHLEPLSSFLDGVFIKSKFKKLFPQDIGFTMSNPLQSFDWFCQTYVLFTYFLIILNPNINPIHFAIMLNNNINHEMIICLLFMIYEILKVNGYVINKNNILTYSTSSLNNIINLLHNYTFYENQSHIKETDTDDIILIKTTAADIDE